MRRDAPHAASVGRFWGPRALPSLDITPSPPPPSRLCLRRDMVMFLHTAQEALEEQEREWAASECPKKARAAKVIRDCLEYHGDHDVVYIPFREPGQDPSAVRARARERISKPTTPPPLCVALPLASSLETFRASQRSPLNGAGGGGGAAAAAAQPKDTWGRRRASVSQCVAQFVSYITVCVSRCVSQCAPGAD